MKNFSKWAAAILVCTPAIALATTPTVTTWSGFYAGGFLGVNNAKSDNTGSANAATFGLLGGYDYRFSRPVVLGADVFYEDNRPTNHSSPIGTVSYGSRIWGVDAQAGYVLGNANQWLPYLKIGYGRGQGTRDLSGSSSGLRYGIGIEWRLYRHLGITFQYMRQKLGSADDNLTNDNLTVGADWHFYSP